MCEKSVCVKKKWKILELTERKEAVLFDKIPRKKEMSLRTALREVKREEAEKLRFFQPPIPLVQEESHYELCDKKELVLLVNTTAANSVDKKITIKKKFPVLKSGTVEDYLKWTNDMWYIVKNKPCTSAGSKFDLIKCFLQKKLWKNGRLTKQR